MNRFYLEVNVLLLIKDIIIYTLFLLTKIQINYTPIFSLLLKQLDLTIKTYNASYIYVIRQCIFLQHDLHKDGADERLRRLYASIAHS